MYLTLGWLLLATLPFSASPPPAHADPAFAEGSGRRVAVWTDRADPYRRGEPARVYLEVREPSYLAVLRVDTDGRMRVLFPRAPRATGYVGRGREVEVTGGGEAHAFRVDDDPGVGYVFAVASARPLDFRAVTRGGEWDFRLVGERVRGDPYVSLTDLAERLAPGGDYDYDIAPYYVGHRYDYPRFVCYDCHAPATYDEWNPYRTACPRFRVVVRDDPRYYPYHYGGWNVVADRPAHPGPRYVFLDAGQGDRDAPPRLRRTRPLLDERPGLERRRERADSGAGAPPALRPANAPRSTGEPELRRRRP